MSEKIPEGWKLFSINSFLGAESLFCDGDWVESKDQDEEGINRLIQLADIGDGAFLNKSARYMNNAQFNKLRCTELKPGDILIARMPDPLGRACLFPDLNQRCATVVDVAILRSPEANINWLMYMINSHGIRRQIESLSAGTTRTRISRKLFSNVLFLTPSFTVQKHIAEVLMVIDQTIEKTEALIEKYQQIKAGLMNDLFTRGIGADGKLRPPCAQAPELYQQTPIGWIPKEWGFDTLKNIFGAKNIVNGPFGSDLLTSELKKEGIPVLYCQDIKPGYFSRVSKSNVTPIKAAQLSFCNVRKNDILLAKVGSPPCDSCVYDEDINAVVTQDVIRVRPAAEHGSVFFSSWFNSGYGRQAIKKISIEGTRERVSLGEFKELIVPLPDNKEQQAISIRINQAQSFIAEEKRNLKKLKQQKSGLMHDLLTGKVTVKIESDKLNDNKDQELIEKLSQAPEVAEALGFERVQEYV